MRWWFKGIGSSAGASTGGRWIRILWPTPRSELSDRRQQRLDTIRTVGQIMSTDLFTVQPGDIVDIRKIRAAERRMKFSQLFAHDPARGVSPQVVVRPVEELPQR